MVYNIYGTNGNQMTVDRCQSFVWFLFFVSGVFFRTAFFRVYGRLIFLRCTYTVDGSVNRFKRVYIRRPHIILVQIFESNFKTRVFIVRKFSMRWILLPGGRSFRGYVVSGVGSYLLYWLIVCPMPWYILWIICACAPRNFLIRNKNYYANVLLLLAPQEVKISTENAWKLYVYTVQGEFYLWTRHRFFQINMENIKKKRIIRECRNRYKYLLQYNNDLV